MVYTNRARDNKRRPARVGRAVVSIALAACAAAPVAAAEPSRVRSTDAAVLSLLHEGAERSASFQALVDAIDRSNGIVYVQFGVCAFGHLNGCLLPFVVPSPNDRYLRILVTGDSHRRTHEQLLALIAHELQHAREVIDHDEVVDVASMEAMYRRTGVPLTGGLSGYETSAARAAGDRVLAELLVKRPAGTAMRP